MNETPTILSSEYAAHQASIYQRNNIIHPEDYQNVDVKRGLRNKDQTGVIAGLTRIANVRGYVIEDGEKQPAPGRLLYRGIDVADFIEGCTAEGHFGYEEAAYLLLFGELPTLGQLTEFKAVISTNMVLPNSFTEDMILKAPCKDIMNKLNRCVLSLYSYDDNPDDISLPNLLRQSIELIARFPIIVAHAHAAKRHYFNNESLYIHRVQPQLSIAENFLYAVRPDNSFTAEEAKILDLCLILHAEHGGGNNSAFACRVLSSSGTDTYSAIGAAIGSLKGPRHGGANMKVMQMFREIQTNLSDWTDEKTLLDYLCKILRKEAGDGSGLIYGMGHAVYTEFDPRAKILKNAARTLAEQKGMEEELQLMEKIEELAPAAFSKVAGRDKILCANVDMYSGLIYNMLDIPTALYTPIFAIARVAGWCAHRMEEATPGGKIIRPAYKAAVRRQCYVPIADRSYQA